MQDVPRPEHPRPQFVRDEWLTLNGKWQFEIDPGASGEEKGWQTERDLAREILVPFCPESTLSGIGEKDFMPAVWYRRFFAVPDDWAGKRVLLHCDAIDYEATVWVNGAKAGSHRGGYTRFSLEVTDLLKSESNELVIRAVDDVRSGLQPGGKQSERYDSYGCHYTRTTGIWQTVWLEAAPTTFIRTVKLIPDLDGGRLILHLGIDGSCEGTLVRVRALADGNPAGEATAPASGALSTLILDLSDARPWSIETPFLYDLELSLETDGQVTDRVQSYFGLRKVHIEGKKILLNNQPVFQRLVLDQRFYPDGIYTAPTDEALRRDIELSQAVGFNGARLHQKVFEPRFLYWADKLGYIVWGEFPDWGLDLRRPEAVNNFVSEWLEAVDRDFCHPAVVGWCPLNESSPGSTRYVAPVIANLYHLTKAADPTRPVLDTSGYTHVCTDVYDCHNYNQNVEEFVAAFEPLKSSEEVWRNYPDQDAAYEGQPYFVSEYGGIWWNPGQKDEQSWGYGQRPDSEQEFLERYRGLTEALLFHPKMCGFCYTQLYDIEQEVNGLYTYSREPKFNAAAIHRINTQKAAIET